MKLVRGLLAGALATTAVVEYLFWGMGLGGVGKTLFFVLLLGAYYLAIGMPVGKTRDKIEHFALAFSVLVLSLTYGLFDNQALQLLNFAANLFLLGLLFLQGVMGDTFRWDSVTFQLEQAMGYIIRPFARIHSPWIELSRIGKEGKTQTRKKTYKTLLSIFLALVVCAPLLLVLSLLLFSADPVFASMFEPFFRSFQYFRIDKFVGKVFIFVLLAPFVLSAIWSYIDKFFVLKEYGDVSKEQKKLPSAFAITILAMVNGLYLLYAFVQFRYLFSAGSGVLPGNLTYAEYARNGFFELAFVALINIFMMILSVRFTTREGSAGIVLRLMSILLMVLSTVQLVSAFMRMGLYIEVYGLSMLRYFVTAFMILAAACFVFVLIREFIPKFPMFKSFVFAGALALVILNYSVPDYQIANYNTQKYLSGQITEYDIGYLKEELSASGHIVILENEKALLEKDKDLAWAFKDLREPPFEDEFRDKNEDYKMFVYCKERFALMIKEDSAA